MKNLALLLIVGAVAYSMSGRESTPPSYEPPPPAYDRSSRVIEQPAPTTNAANCHPSYSGCLRIDASDYDCVGGQGNGPYYTGEVRIIGPDVFELDSDDDGLGCDGR